MKLARIPGIATFLTISLSLAVQAQTTWYVDDDALPGGDGTTWPTAYKFLQDALAVATSEDEIHVGEGTYKPDQDEANPEGTGHRTATFQLITGVGLHGGYRGCPDGDCLSGNPDERKVNGYKTTLSGDLLGNDELYFANNGDNSYGIITASDAGDGAHLEGFTVIGGNANEGNPRHSSLAGGMSAYISNVRVNKCRFEYNAAYSDGTVGGGAICNSGGNVRLTDCVFYRNQGFFKVGGAVGNNRGQLTAIGCVFQENSSDWTGGAIWSEPDTNLVIQDCAFWGNTTGTAGGAIKCCACAQLHVVNSTFVRNSADAGGVLEADNPTTRFVNCSFVFNMADAGSILWLTGGNSELCNCIAWGNSPALFYLEVSATLSASHSAIQGGWPGLCNINAKPLFMRSPGDGGDGWGDDPATPGVDEGANDDYGDLTLQAGSPCIDTGNNAAGGPCQNDQECAQHGFDRCRGDGFCIAETDLAGQPRFVDDRLAPDCWNCPEPSDCGISPIVDMGAYEYEGQPAIPAVSEWGLVVFALLLLTAAKIHFRYPSGQVA